MSRIRLTHALLTAIVCIAAPAAIAQTPFTWQGVGTTSNWSLSANWTTFAPPNTGTASLFFSDANMSGAASFSPHMDANYSIDSMSFGGGSSFNLVTDSGHTLTVGTGGMTLYSTADQTIAIPIILGGTQVWNFQSTGNLNASGGVNLNGQSLVIDTAGTNTLNGAITGAGSVGYAGNGTLILSSTGNTYSGNSTVSGGTLEFTGNMPSGAIYSSAGATLLFAQPNGGTFSAPYVGSGNLAVSGSSIGSTFVLGSSLNVYTGATLVEFGTLQMGAAGVIPSSSVVTLGSGSNPGVLRLAGFNETIGGLASSGTGASQVTNGGGAGTSTLTINQATNTTFAGVLGGTGTNENNFAIVKSGAGTLTLSGANTFTGGVTISGGVLSITGDSNLGATSGGVMLNGGTLQITGTGNNTVLVSSRSLTLGTAGGAIDTSGLGATGGNTLTITSPIGGSGPLTLDAHGDTSDSGNNSSSRLVLSGANSFTGTVTITSGLVDTSSNFGNAANSISISGVAGLLAANAGTTTINRTITLSGTGDRIFRSFGSATMNLTGTISGSGTLRKTDVGTLVLSGPNTYTGGTTIGSGTIQLGASGTMPAAGNVTINGGGTLNLNGFNQTIGSLTVGSGGSTFANITTGAGVLTLGGDITVNGIPGGHGASIVGNIDLGGASRTVNIGNAQFSQPYDLTIGGPISGAGGLTLSGAPTGRLVLYGPTSTYTGPTTVSVGTLSVGATNALPTGTDLVVAANAIASLTDQYSGLGVSAGNFNQTVNSLSGAGNVALGTATLTISGSASTTFSGAISGTSGGVTKAGTGTLTLSGTNNYAGTTTVSGGTLVVAAAGSLTNSLVTAGPGTAVTINGSITAGNGKYFQLDGTAANPAFATLNAGGSLTAAATDVGNSVNGVGNFTQTGGSHNLTSGLYLGVNSGSVGTYSLGAGTLSTSFNTTVGFGGAGTFIQSGGTHSTNSLILGDGLGSSGAYTLTGGLLNAATSIVGDGGNGNFAQTGGAHEIMNLYSIASLYVGRMAGSTGVYTLSGGTLSTQDAFVGDSGNGTFFQTSGTHIVSAFLYLGNQLGGSGAYTLTSGSLSTSYTIVGSSGSGTFTQSGGTHTITSNLAIGDLSGGQGTYYLNSGTVSDGQAFIGSSGVGAFIQNGGIHVVDTTLTLGNTGGSGAYTLNGGLLQVSGIVGGTGTSAFNFNGGILRSTANNPGFMANLTAATVQIGGAIIDNAGYDVTIPQPLLHDGSLGNIPDGGLNLRGAGALTLTGANTYTGGTTVAGGSLAVASDANLGASIGSVTLLNGGQLQFTGSVTTGRTFNLNSSALSPAAGNSITYQGATVNGGYLRGPGTHIVTGNSVFSGVTAYPDATISLVGPASFVNFTNGGTMNVAAGLTGPTTFNGFTNQGSGTITVGANSQVNVSDFETYGTLTLANGASSSKSLLTNTGTTPLYFNGGSRTFIGAVGGNGQAQLELNGQNAIVAGGLFVNNGQVTDNSIAGVSTIIADYGALVKGAGQFDNSPITRNGGKFQAGNSPGVATVGRFVFGSGGVSNYVFAIDNATGQAGPTPDANGQVSGWGLVKTGQLQRSAGATSGDFVWTADSSNKLTVSLDTLINPTLSGTDPSGLMANFDPTKPYSWPAVEWVGAYSGPTSVAALDAATSFDTTGFENPIDGTFGWSLSGSSLSLSYTPSAVPEPGTFALAAMAAIGWVTFWRRRWQSNDPAATLST